MARQSPLSEKLLSLLESRKQKSTYRQLTPPNSDLVDFSSNDFLSLSQSPVLREKYLQEIQTLPSFALSASSSRLLDGNSSYAESLEKNIAKFHNAPSGLLFNSGYDANTGFWSCVPQPGDVILFDTLVHASVHEGMKLSRAAKTISFRHNSVEDLRAILEDLLRKDNGFLEGTKNVFVSVESLYSMDGDVCPLREMVEVVERLLPLGNGYVVVDEAHSTGIYGYQGRGFVCDLGLEKRVFMRLITFGKAMGCSGAIILCENTLKQYLVNYARPLIYTTFMPPTTLAAIKVVYEHNSSGGVETLTQHLRRIIEHFHLSLRALLSDHFKYASNIPSNLIQLPEIIKNSPIISLQTTDPRSLAIFCRAEGFTIRPIMPPTVPKGAERVRICLHAGNTIAEVEGLVARIGMWLASRDRRIECGMAKL